MKIREKWGWINPKSDSTALEQDERLRGACPAFRVVLQRVLQQPGAAVAPQAVMSSGKT